MNFEDYNYDMYNKFILIDPNKNVEEHDHHDHSGRSENKKVGFAPPAGSLGKKGTLEREDDASADLTEKQLSLSVKEEFTHDLILVETEEERKTKTEAENQKKRDEQ